MSKFKPPLSNTEPGDSNDSKNKHKQQQEEKDEETDEVTFDWSGAQVIEVISHSWRDRQMAPFLRVLGI